MAGRPRGSKNKPKEPTPPDDRDEGEIDEDGEGEGGDGEPEEDEDDFLPWEEDLKNWEIEQRQADEISRFSLFRKAASNKGQEKVYEWYGEIPTSHEIGLRFGGGHYTAYLMLPRIRGQKKQRFRSRRFTLADTYTHEKRKADLEAGINAPTLYGAPQPQNSPANSIEMIGMIINQIVVPLMGARPQQAADPFSQFKGFSDAMIQVTEASARSQIQLTRELQKELALGRPQKEEAADTAAEGDFKEFIKDVLKEYGPMIVEAGALKMKSIASQLKRDEVFQALSADQNLFARVLHLLTRDPDVDKGLASKVLEKLARMNIGIKVPLGVLTSPASAPQTTGAQEQ